MDHLAQSKFVDEISSFIRSDGWRLVKYKVLLYKKSNQDRVNASVRAKDTDKAQYFLGLMDGALATLEMTERLPGEINKGKLAVDVALRVIENKQGE